MKHTHFARFNPLGREYPVARFGKMLLIFHGVYNAGALECDANGSRAIVPLICDTVSWRKRDRAISLRKVTETMLAEIDWQGAEMPARVATFNLAKVGANARFCNVD